MQTIEGELLAELTACTTFTRLPNSQARKSHIFAELTRFYHVLLIIMHIQVFISSSISSPRGSKFLISLASIPNDENMRFQPASFFRLIVNLRFAQNGTKTCHSTGKTLFFMTIQKLRSYTR